MSPRVPESSRLPGSAYPWEDSATGLPEWGRDQRCDGDEDEHCAMIACVGNVVSFHWLDLGFLGVLDPPWGSRGPDTCIRNHRRVNLLNGDG